MTSQTTATSPVRAHIRELQSSFEEGGERRAEKTPFSIERGTADRPYTDEQVIIIRTMFLNSNAEIVKYLLELT